jgi:hypothetical protein
VFLTTNDFHPSLFFQEGNGLSNLGFREGSTHIS